METLTNLSRLLALLPGTDREHAKLIGVGGPVLCAWYGALDGRLEVSAKGTLTKAKYRLPEQRHVDAARAAVERHLRHAAEVLAMVPR